MDRVGGGSVALGEALANITMRVDKLARMAAHARLIAAEIAAQDKRDADDELDWLGGYQGRRDR